jgi:hypothetical protein
VWCSSTLRALPSTTAQQHGQSAVLVAPQLGRHLGRTLQVSGCCVLGPSRRAAQGLIEGRLQLTTAFSLQTTGLLSPTTYYVLPGVAHGVLYCSQQQERSARRHRCDAMVSGHLLRRLLPLLTYYYHSPLRLATRYDTIVEGVGIDRVTANLEQAQIDSAYRVTDGEAKAMAKHLLAEEGLSN